MRHFCLLGLTLTLASCSPNTPEGLARSFCKELSAGRWEKALKVIGRDTQVSSSLAAAPADERQITEAMKLAAAEAIAGMVPEPTADEIVPSVFAPGVAEAVADAVRRVAAG